MGNPTLRLERRADALAIGLILVGVGLYVLASNYLTALATALLMLIVGAVIVIRGPALALGLLIVPTVLFEDGGEGGFLPGLSQFYEGRVISPFEALLGLAALATVLDVARRRELRMPDPLTFPLMLAALASVIGLIVGTGNGAVLSAATQAARPMVPLLVLPIVVVNVLRDETAIRRFLIVIAALIGFKAAVGLVSIVVGQGYMNPGDPPITYLEPAINFLSIAVVLVLVARLLQRERPPMWLLVVSALSLASLVLSYRRSFWIAAVAGLLIVLLIGLQQRRWLTIAPILAAVAFAIWLTSSTGTVGDLQGPIAERAASLNPASLQTDPQDSYRIGERRNVVAEIEEHPISGIGLAVPWIARYPLSLDRPLSREYVHFTALWWWLKLGLLGLVAYLSVMGSSIWASFRVWREQGDPWFRAFGLGMVGAIAGLGIAETTAAFLGVTPRLTAIFGTAIGIIASMLASAKRTGI